ncbi:glucosamine--fructose-6-phosphate aminotransferase, partial [Haemophilus influenzae]
RQKKRLMMVL